MLVKDVGEFRLIEMLAEVLGTDPAGRDVVRDEAGFELKKSIGDDAAVWKGPAATTVMTSDTMVDGVHFNLDHTGWSDLGWKAMAVNLSDVAAMGCAPLYSTVTLGLKAELPVDGLKDMYRGMAEACRLHGGSIVGGDVVRSPTFFVAVTMTGSAAPSEKRAAGSAPLLARDRASVGDVVAVTGSLGCSRGGLRMLLEGLCFDADVEAHLGDTHNRPTPRVAEGLQLARHGVKAAIDVSDGLVDDLGKLCQASGVGARIVSDRVPVDAFLRRAYRDDWLTFALSGGEDYELLFTADRNAMEQVTSTLDVPATVIGEIVDRSLGVTVVDVSGAVVPAATAGWDHFGQTE